MPVLGRLVQFTRSCKRSKVLINLQREGSFQELLLSFSEKNIQGGREIQENMMLHLLICHCSLGQKDLKVFFIHNPLRLSVFQHKVYPWSLGQLEMYLFSSQTVFSWNWHHAAAARGCVPRCCVF